MRKTALYPRQRLLAGIASVLAALIPAASRASVIRHDTPDSLYTDLANTEPYAPVGSVFYNASGGSLTVGSGVLVTPKIVLTAAHVVNTSDSRVFNIGAGTWLGGASHNDSFRLANPDFNGLGSGGDDIGLMFLSSAVSGIKPATRYFLTDEVSRLGTYVGFGVTGNGNTGANNATYGTKRAFTNMLDANGSAVSYDFRTIVSDFDDPGNADGRNFPAGSSAAGTFEGILAGGDSGGGLFIDVGGRTYLAGINSAIFNLAHPNGDGFTNASYSDLSLATRVVYHNEWIDDNITHTWNSASSGAFGAAGNWNFGPSLLNQVPTNNDVVGFSTAGSYSITLGGPVSNHMLLARGGSVTVDLSASTWTLTSTMFEGGLVVGRYAGNSASLILNNGTLSVRDAIVSQLSGSTGRLIIGGNATLSVSGDLYVGGSFVGGGGSGSLNLTTATSSVNVNGLLRVYSGGRVNYNGGTLSVGALEVANGTVTLSAGGDKVLRAGALSVTGNGKIDLADNDMIVDYAGASPLSNIRSLIRSGHNGGNWLGNGIRTSSGNAANFGLGYADNTTLGLATFSGQFVDATSILIKYTYFGDADLDGDVDGIDVGVWAQNFTGELGGNGPMLWTDGDWDYDGDVDGVDVGAWAQNFTGELGGAGLSVIHIETAIDSQAMAILQGLGISVVPEPAALGLLAAAALLRRRRLPTAR